MIEFLGRRPSAASSSSFHRSLIGRVLATSSFRNTQQRLFTRIMEAIQECLKGSKEINGIDEKENQFVHKLVSNARLIALLNTGALASWTSAAVFTATGTVGWAAVAAGIGLGFPLAAGGAAVLYTRGPRALARKHNESWRTKSVDLARKLDAIFDDELDAVEHKVRESVRPYTRFVETKSENIAELLMEYEDAAETARRLRDAINIYYDTRL